MRTFKVTLVFLAWLYHLYKGKEMVDSFEKDAIFIFKHIEFDVISQEYVFQNQSTEEFLCIPFLYICVSYFFFQFTFCQALPLIFQSVYSRVSC